MQTTQQTLDAKKARLAQLETELSAANRTTAQARAEAVNGSGGDWQPVSVAQQLAASIEGALPTLKAEIAALEAQQRTEAAAAEAQARARAQERAQAQVRANIEAYDAAAAKLDHAIREGVAAMVEAFDAGIGNHAAQPLDLEYNIVISNLFSDSLDARSRQVLQRQRIAA